MRILLLLTSVFGLTGGVHTFNRALIKATDDLAGDFGLDVTVFSLLDGEVPLQAAADYMSSGRPNLLGAGADGTRRCRSYVSADPLNSYLEGILAF